MWGFGFLNAWQNPRVWAVAAFFYNRVLAIAELGLLVTYTYVERRGTYISMCVYFAYSEEILCPVRKL